MSIADINGTQIHYEITGSGDPLVLIHAGLCDSRMWADQVEEFALIYRVIRYDVRGHGKSPAPDGASAHHEDLRALLDYLAIQKTILVGASMGGTIALDFTLAYPEKVTALVTIGSSPSGTTASDALRQKWAEIDAVLESGDLAGAVEMELQLWVDGVGRTPDQVDHAMRELVRVMNANNFAMANEQAEATPLQPPAVDRLGEIRVPVLVVAGDLDVLDKAAVVEKMVTEIPNAEKVIMTDTAHLPSMERPAEFNQLVLDFLRKNSL